MTKPPARDVTLCTSCRQPIEGTKIATPDAGVLCPECARASHGIPMPREFDSSGRPIDW